MTLNELRKKYKGYEVYYWGKSTFIKTLADCKHNLPYTGLSGVNAKDYGKLEVIDYEVFEKPFESIDMKLTNKGLIGKGKTQYKGYVYALLSKEG